MRGSEERGVEEEYQEYQVKDTGNEIISRSRLYTIHHQGGSV